MNKTNWSKIQTHFKLDEENQKKKSSTELEEQNMNFIIPRSRTANDEKYRIGCRHAKSIPGSDKIGRRRRRRGGSIAPTVWASLALLLLLYGRLSRRGGMADLPLEGGSCNCNRILWGDASVRWLPEMQLPVARNACGSLSKKISITRVFHNKG